MRTKLESKPKPLGPEESPEKRSADVQQAHTELKQAIARMQQGQSEIFQLLAQLIGLPHETNRARLIWQGLVDFANLDTSNGFTDSYAVFSMRAVIALSVQSNVEYDDMIGEILNLELFDDVYSLHQQQGLTVDQAFAVLAAQLHPKIRLLLHWLADPNRMPPTERHTALSFLIEHGHQVLARYRFDPNDEFDDTGNVGAPLFFWKHPDSFGSVLEPVAHFLYERVEQYHDSEITLAEAIPIVLCKRDGCGKLSVLQRNTKDFCSSSCRTLHRQKDKAADHAAYMRHYRKDQLTKLFPSRKPRRSSL